MIFWLYVLPAKTQFEQTTDSVERGFGHDSAAALAAS